MSAKKKSEPDNKKASELDAEEAALLAADKADEDAKSEEERKDPEEVMKEQKEATATGSPNAPDNVSYKGMSPDQRRMRNLPGMPAQFQDDEGNAPEDKTPMQMRDIKQPDDGDGDDGSE